MVMGKMIMKEKGIELAWSTRQGIMFKLFDIGRLMIEDEKRFNAFQNEIANLCNESYEKVRKSVENGEDEKESFKMYFGYNQRNLLYDEIPRPCSSLYSGLEELISFMYGDSNTCETKIKGFLMRSQNAIDSVFESNYIL